MYKILESLDQPSQVSITSIFDIIINLLIVQVISMVIVIMFFLISITKTLLFINFFLSLSAVTQLHLSKIFIPCILSVQIDGQKAPCKLTSVVN